jgi:hypothetical protein
MVSKKFCDFCHVEIGESEYELEIVQFGNTLDVCNICLGKINGFLNEMKR